MRCMYRYLVVIALATLWLPAVAVALETDQYTVPDEPLADIGPAIGQHVHQAIEKIVADLNAQIAALEAQLPEASDRQAKRLQKKLAALRTERIVADRLFAKLGKRAIECELELWVRKKDWGERPAVYELPVGDSVTGVPLTHLLVAFGNAPTIHTYGVHMGTDKLGHFFQQGHEYYRLYLRHEAQKMNEADNLAAVIKHGVKQEQGIYGRFASGIYSNADLAADYAGLKFYLNLTRPVQIGHITHPPLLAVAEGRWRFAQALPRDPFEPFVSHHFDEARNPCLYNRSHHNKVRREIRGRAERWLAYHQATPEAVAQQAEALTTWHGEPYGHSGAENLYTLADAHAQNQPAPPAGDVAQK